MAFTKLVETRRGRLAIRVLRDSSNGDLLLAADRIRANGVARGVLLSWSEVRYLIGFVRTNAVLPETQSARQHGGQLTLATFGENLARAEIQQAIRGISAVNRQANGVVVTYVPSLPKFRYLYTCPVCGCHVPSHFSVPSNDGEKLRLCSNCQCVYEVDR